MSTFKVKVRGKLVRTFKTGSRYAALRYIERTNPAAYCEGDFKVIELVPQAKR